MLLLCACASPALAEWQDRYLSQDTAVFDRAFAQEALKLSTLIYYRDQQAAYMRKAGFNTVGYWNFHRPAGDTRHICAYYVYQKALPDEDGLTGSEFLMRLSTAILGQQTAQLILDISALKAKETDFDPILNVLTSAAFSGELNALTMAHMPGMYAAWLSVME